MMPRPRHILLCLLLLSPLPLGACEGSGQSQTKTNDAARDLREALRVANDAKLAQEAGDYERAVTLGRQAIRLNGELGFAWNNLGIALMSRGKELDYIEASQAFKRAADLLVNDERPFENLGVLYFDRGFDEEALRHFVLALERNPRAIRSLRGAIIASKRLLRSDEAGLARINTALMIETDSKWREIMEFERVRVERDLADARTNRRT